MNKQSIQFLFFIFLLIVIACQNSNEISPPEFKSFPVKSISEIEVNDFVPSTECESCHPIHFEEWSHSMHALSIKDPVFLLKWEEEQNLHTDTGERFCIQCHSPISFVTGTYLDNIKTIEDMENSGIAEVIQEGIGCDFCHSITRASRGGNPNGVEIEDNLEATAEYNLYPGEGVKYGPIESPVETNYHTSEFNSLYRSSAVCLPCHNMTVRSVKAEMTFTEWNDEPEFQMTGIHCQECHMLSSTGKAAINGPDREIHSHTFVGVDLDLSQPAETSPQFDDVTTLLKDAVALEIDGLIENIDVGDTLEIPAVVISKTGHSLPSGVSFSREAWLELVVRINDNIIFSSGVVTSNTSPLDMSDVNLLLFTTYLLKNEAGDTTNFVSEAHGIIDNTLKAASQRSHVYKFKLLENMILGNSNGKIIIQLRMLFRSFKPGLLQAHSALLENLAIFEMASIVDTVYIQSP